MSTPKEILISRFGDLLLQKKEKIEMVSRTEEKESGIYSVYQTLIEVGASLPVLVAVLCDASFDKKSALLKDIPFKSLHVRSYRNWSEFEELGVKMEDDLQTLDYFSTEDLPNFEMTAVKETDSSRTYKFEDEKFGSMTLFTLRARNSKFSHGLPTRTRFLGWINEYNFVFV